MECDAKSCPATALFVVMIDDHELVFCGHHYHEYEPFFMTLGLQVHEVTTA